MVRFQVIRLQLDGTNDVPVQLPTSMTSLTIYGDTTSVQLLYRPSQQSDFAPLNNGGSITLEPLQPGLLIEPSLFTFRAVSALTVYLVVGLP